MFDFANSAYTTVIVTVAYSIYFTKLVAPGDGADALWGLGVLLSNLLVVLGAPVLGAIADDSGRKKPWMAATWLLCVAGTASLALVGPGAVALGLALFVLSNVGYAWGESLAGAFLPELATPQTMGRVSGFAWGLGYVGGLGSLLVVLPLLEPGFTLENLPNLRLAWLATAAFFFVGAIPTFIFLRERAPRAAARPTLSGFARRGFARLATTMHALGHFRQLARFLAVFVVFSCGLTSVIAFAAIYAERTIGFSSAEVIGLFVVLQVAATVGALVFGSLQDRLGARRTIEIALILWLAVSAGAALCATKGLFWVVALSAGLGIGSLQSSSRALVGLMTPAAKTGEFFGFWGLSMRIAYMIGPAVFGLVSSVTGSQRLAIAVNAAFFLVGLLGMRFVDEAEGRRAAETWQGSAPAAGLPQPSSTP